MIPKIASGRIEWNYVQTENFKQEYCGKDAV